MTIMPSQDALCGGSLWVFIFKPYILNLFISSGLLSLNDNLSKSWANFSSSDNDSLWQHNIIIIGGKKTMPECLSWFLLYISSIKTLTIFIRQRKLFFLFFGKWQTNLQWCTKLRLSRLCTWLLWLRYPLRTIFCIKFKKGIFLQNS
jgi:hypothetical protein